MNQSSAESEIPVEKHYPKLVRDRIPEFIEREGKIPNIHIADPKEYLKLLLSKLVEEATELKEATTTNHQKEELADVLEVIDAVYAALGFTKDEIREIQTHKAEERGGFMQRVILDGKSA